MCACVRLCVCVSVCLHNHHFGFLCVCVSASRVPPALPSLFDQAPKYEAIADGENDSAAVRSARWWKNYQDRNDSFLVDLLVGQLQSTLTCQQCSYVSVVYDPFWDLSLPIPKDTAYALSSETSLGNSIVEAFASKFGGNSSRDRVAELPTCKLSDCFRFFTTPEMLRDDDQVYCSRCKTHRNFTKKMAIYRLPEVLVIHLKRFMYNKFTREKISTDVQFPLEGLSLKEFSVKGSPAGETAVYDLYAVSNHMGGLGGGHYTAHARTGIDEGPTGLSGWHTFNDSRVSPVNLGTLGGPGAYVLFYHRRNG